MVLTMPLLLAFAFGRLTQRLECHPHTVEVTGSNPVTPISYLHFLTLSLI